MTEAHEETGTNGDEAELWVNLERTGTEVGYKLGVLEGDSIRAVCVNPEDPDNPSVVVGKNDGFFVVTFPDGYHGRCRITVSGSDGGSLSGEIEV